MGRIGRMKKEPSSTLFLSYPVDPAHAVLTLFFLILRFYGKMAAYGNCCRKRLYTF